MCKNKQSIHYCTILSDEQWNFILEGRFSRPKAEMPAQADDPRRADKDRL